MSASTAPLALSRDTASIPGAAVKPKRLDTRRLLIAGGVVLAVGFGGRFGWEYWTEGRFIVSTDDATVQADTVTVAPKVSGYLSEVLVRDNEAVRAGQVLARIDPRDFEARLDQARADTAAARAALAAARAELAMQEPTIEQARAVLAVDAANERFDEQDNQRYAALASTGYGTTQDAQRAASRIAGARAGVTRDAAALRTATARLALLQAQVAQAEATVAHDAAVQQEAALDLGYTTIVAPENGTVGNRTLRVGQYVQAGTQLMSLVPLDRAYVIANYKETQLADVKPGQPATIEVDMFPGQVAHGRVDSIAPASGAEFALLPPDNATGNFTKVVQRLPVKIVLDPRDPLAAKLRPGMSVEPGIDTRASVGR